MWLRLSGLLACLVLGFTATGAQEDAKTVVAAAVRDHGYRCASPESVKPDPADSGPDEKAWVIRCESGSYRVKFKGDAGAEVEPLTG